jgi:hypothetical protein
MFLENTICEKTFSVSSTSNSLTFAASFPDPADDTLCEWGKSLSLRAQKTRPGGYKSAICMFASSVFLVARNFPGKKDHARKNRLRNSNKTYGEEDAHPVYVLSGAFSTLPLSRAMRHDRVSFPSTIVVRFAEP